MAARALKLLKNRIGNVTALFDFPPPAVWSQPALRLPCFSSSEPKGAHRPHLTCWHCHELLDCMTDKFFCRSCDFVQPPLACNDYFAFFDLPKTFDVDLELLRRHFRNLQFSLHPDKFTRRSEKEKAFSEEQAAKINDAYFTLLKPLSRAIYMLTLRGYGMEEGNNQTSVSPEILMEVLEANEEIDSLNPVAGSADEQRLHEMRQQFASKLKACEQGLEKAFADDNLAQAKALVSEMKFYNSLFERMLQTEKNFRLSYLAKVGFPGVDLEKAIDQLLSAKVVEREKLVQLSFTHELPNSHRLKTWNLLIGVSARHQECADFVLKQRKEHLNLLFNSLHVMHLTCHPLDWSSVDVPCSILSFAYVLEQSLCPLGMPEEYPMFTTVHSVVKLLTKETLEQYWLCRNICLLLEKSSCIRSSVISEAENFLTKNEAELCEVALSDALSPKAALQFCFDWTFYSPFHPEVLLRLWDKMVAGSLVINLFVLIECLRYIQRFGKVPLESKDDLASSIEQISQSKQQNLVECAMDCWLHKGKQMESRLSIPPPMKGRSKQWSAFSQQSSL
ncbi:hypothetical protein M514_06838 [Trichuris suis]|uniref:J domain-containing protein n=1 Tax=Trichuris suis TaxID=68888 RepID=A0A085M4X9_9BILA|nr:hypothetical protein M513_06838 [Trichuris suis]KFD66738.1 hypothetical protein M514_06838 [Trichuris suis]